MNRFVTNKDHVKSITLELIKNYMSAAAASKPHAAPIVPIKRTVTGAPATPSSAAIDNKNFIRLLQNICGLDQEIRTIALSRMDQWLFNPKLESCAQDLLMAICCNLSCVPNPSSPTISIACFPVPTGDSVFVQQIIKIKPKLKQNQHYFDCIR